MSCGSVRKPQRVGIRLRKREHVLGESLDGEGSGTVENGALEVILQSDLAALERRNQGLMAAFEFVFIFIQAELLESLLALLVVPRIAEQYAANVPEKSIDSCQDHPPKLRLVTSGYLTSYGRVAPARAQRVT